jgi:hypothetical protein
MQKPKKSIRLVIHVDQAMADSLRERRALTGTSVGEIIRSAIRFTDYADSLPHLRPTHRWLPMPV